MPKREVNKKVTQGQIKGKESLLEPVLWNSLAVLGCLALLTIVLDLLDADLSIPFAYSGDAVFSATIIKGIMDNGWFLYNPFLGVPVGQYMYDFPQPEYVFYLLIKIISLFTNKWPVVLNTFYLLGFPLTTVVSVFVMRDNEISYPAAVVFSLLYTFLPYHFIRGEGHLWLSAYYFVPLMIMVIIWLFRYKFDEIIIKGKGQKSIKINFINKRMVTITVICVCVALGGVYYAFFFCYFLLMSGFFLMINTREWRRLIMALIMLFITSSILLISISPNIMYGLKNGSNPVCGIRNPSESEIYGMKIIQLIMPIHGHRIDILSDIATRYYSGAPLVNENSMVSLGLVGSIGFLLLVFNFMFRCKKLAYITYLGFVNMCAVLLATIGGFGTIFAYFISPQIRAYNRISVFIAFLSFLALAYIASRLIEKFQNKGWRKVSYLALVMILVFGLLDMTSKSYEPAYADTRSRFISDQQFVQMIESSVPKGSSIYQLPFMPFPENGPINRTSDYDFFKGYLHSKDLRWSYGAIRGRNHDIWQQQVSQQPVEEMVKDLAFAGFAGIYIDRWGYSDNAVQLEKDIQKMLSSKPLISNDGRFAFFQIAQYSTELQEQYSDDEWNIMVQKVLHPVVVEWSDGFYGSEGDSYKNWHWCSSKGKLVLNSDSNEIRKVRVECQIYTGYIQENSCIITGSDFSDNIKTSDKGNRWTRTMEIKPGKTIIEFNCDAPQVMAPGDSRFLIFRLEDFRIEDL